MTRSLLFACITLSLALAGPALAQEPFPEDDPLAGCALPTGSLAEPEESASDAPAPPEPPEAGTAPGGDETGGESAGEGSLPVGAWEDYPRDVAFEVNVLWPFFPGGLTDLRFTFPVLLPDRGAFRGEVVLGLHSDFGWRTIRESDDYGRVAILALKVGWRQFFGYGLHLEVVLNAGWRNEVDNPIDGEPIDSFQGRLWIAGGYQHELTRDVYVNVRGLLGVHVFRTDRFADRERILTGGADINLGFRF